MMRTPGGRVSPRARRVRFKRVRFCFRISSTTAWPRPGLLRASFALASPRRRRRHGSRSQQPQQQPLPSALSRVNERPRALASVQGGDGVISVTANVAPAAVSRVMAAAAARDAVAAEAADSPLAALHRDLFCEANPIPVKWALAKMVRRRPTLDPLCGGAARCSRSFDTRPVDRGRRCSTHRACWTQSVGLCVSTSDDLSTAPRKSTSRTLHTTCHHAPFCCGEPDAYPWAARSPHAPARLRGGRAALPPAYARHSRRSGRTSTAVWRQRCSKPTASSARRRRSAAALAGRHVTCCCRATCSTRT
eukprot:833226-Prymnesium_polylepis.1